MPSVNSGKHIVKSVKVYKDHVTVFFAKRENIKISKEAYLSAYLYEGKSISKKEIDQLIEITAFSKLLNYALSLISKRHYSERKMFEKLKAKENNYQAINNVIAKLKENDLLDDRAYMYDLIAWDDERLFGKNKIIKHLKDAFSMLIQGKEQQLCFAGAAMKRYPTSKVRETQVPRH